MPLLLSSRVPRLVLLVVAILTARIAATEPKTSSARNYDVVIYGATASGVAMAITVAREGGKVALLEPTKHVGGMVTGGLSRTDFGNQDCIGGLAREFYKELGKRYGQLIEWYPEPHVAEQVLNTMLKEAHVSVFLQHRLLENDGVTTAAGRITSIKMENGVVFTAQVFADCTYEGDLMAKAGVSYTFGREGRDHYGESLAGVREKTPKHQFKVKVKARDENGKLLPEIQAGSKGVPGAADNKVQAYNFRLCMTGEARNSVPFPKPPDYSPDRYKLLLRLIEATIDEKGTTPTVKDLIHPGPIQKHKTDTNNNGAFSTDYIGGSWNYPDASYAQREQIWQEHFNYVAGFMYFLANDDRIPAELRDELTTWGLAADEFPETGHWPRQLYVREARRMVGEYVMSQRDIQTSLTKPDVIGMGSYNSDSHNVQRIENASGFAANEGDMQVGVKPYQIPYRMITPKRGEAANLLVPVCFSASHVAYSTLRMEPQYMIIGQAAGVAAVLANRNNCAVQDVDTAALSGRLRQLKAVMELQETAAPDVP
ncbi:MAG: FAD-dependent oxidoreductase [Candidatus Sumerlaeaceae bacterium]